MAKMEKYNIRWNDECISEGAICIKWKKIWSPRFQKFWYWAQQEVSRKISKRMKLASQGHIRCLSIKITDNVKFVGKKGRSVFARAQDVGPHGWEVNVAWFGYLWMACNQKKKGTRKQDWGKHNAVGILPNSIVFLADRKATWWCVNFTKTMQGIFPVGHLS